MALSVKKVDVWAGDLADRAGGLADVLAALSDAGASVECVIARRAPDRPGSGKVFISPITGKKAQAAARAAGLKQAADIGTLRVEGADRPGLGAKITQAIADAGISVRGVSAAVLNKKFVAYIGFDSAADAARMLPVLRKVNGAPKKNTSRAGRGNR